MTIDRSIEKLTHEKQCFIDEGWGDTGELEAYDTAISIMRKYQKIKQILKDDFEDYNPLARDPYKLYLIREVIEEDGNK